MNYVDQKKTDKAEMIKILNISKILTTNIYLKGTFV